MARKIMSGVLVACLVFTMMIAGESKFKLSLPGLGMTAACYAACVGECMTSKDKATWASCGTECTGKCAFAAAEAASPLNLSSIDDNTSRQYCQRGCSTSMCSNLSSKDNLNGEKVGSCMGSCSDKCTKNYSP